MPDPHNYSIEHEILALENFHINKKDAPLNEKKSWAAKTFGANVVAHDFEKIREIPCIHFGYEILGNGEWRAADGQTISQMAERSPQFGFNDQHVFDRIFQLRDAFAADPSLKQGIVVSEKKPGEMDRSYIYLYSRNDLDNKIEARAIEFRGSNEALLELVQALSKQSAGGFVTSLDEPLLFKGDTVKVSDIDPSISNAKAEFHKLQQMAETQELAEVFLDLLLNSDETDYLALVKHLIENAVEIRELVAQGDIDAARELFHSTYLREQGVSVENLVESYTSINQRVSIGMPVAEILFRASTNPEITHAKLETDLAVSASTAVAQLGLSSLNHEAAFMNQLYLNRLNQAEVHALRPYQSGQFSGSEFDRGGGGFGGSPFSGSSSGGPHGADCPSPDHVAGSGPSSGGPHSASGSDPDRESGSGGLGGDPASGGSKIRGFRTNRRDSNRENSTFESVRTTFPLLLVDSASKLVSAEVEVSSSLEGHMIESESFKSASEHQSLESKGAKNGRSNVEPRETTGTEKQTGYLVSRTLVENRLETERKIFSDNGSRQVVVEEVTPLRVTAGQKSVEQHVEDETNELRAPSGDVKNQFEVEQTLIDTEHVTLAMQPPVEALDVDAPENLSFPIQIESIEFASGDTVPAEIGLRNVQRTQDIERAEIQFHASDTSSPLDDEISEHSKEIETERDLLDEMVEERDAQGSDEARPKPIGNKIAFLEERSDNHVELDHSEITDLVAVEAVEVHQPVFSNNLKQRERIIELLDAESKFQFEWMNQIRRRRKSFTQTELDEIIFKLMALLGFSGEEKRFIHKLLQSLEGETGELLTERELEEAIRTPLERSKRRSEQLERLPI